MPTRIKKRTWCTTCQEFETFESHLISHDVIVLDSMGGEIKKTSKTTCDVCGNEYVPYLISEVPEDKLLVQRLRYNRMKRDEFLRIMGAYQSPAYHALSDMIREATDTPIGFEIREDDAGQIEIDTALKAARETKRLAAIEFKERYRGAQRNEKCRCDSGLKYKKCCLPEVEKIR